MWSVSVAPVQPKEAATAAHVHLSKNVTAYRAAHKHNASGVGRLTSSLFRSSTDSKDNMRPGKERQDEVC